MPTVRDVEDQPPLGTQPLPAADDSGLRRFVRRRGALVALVIVVVAIVVLYVVVSITMTSPGR